MAELELEIKGMTCDSCARHVEAALRQAGPTEASVDWRRGSVSVTEGEIDERALDEPAGRLRAGPADGRPAAGRRGRAQGGARGAAAGAEVRWVARRVRHRAPCG